MVEDSRTTDFVSEDITRTRVTVLIFNLTIISLMLSLLGARHNHAAHLPSTAALFAGFCLTLLGIFWLLRSQNFDAEGLSRREPFTLGAMTVYLAFSQTVTAVMHEVLVRSKTSISDSQVGLDAIDDSALLVLFAMGAGIWILTTYIAPVMAGLRGIRPGGRRWLIPVYYFAVQVPIYWVYANAYALQHTSPDEPTNVLSLFALQFVQPLIWLH